MSDRKDFRQELTDRLIEQLEAGTAPWQKPWDPREGQLPFNPTTGKSYRGANSLYLGMHGRGDPRWATYKQAAEQGWQVRRGEKGALVEYWKFHDTQPVLDSNGKRLKGQDGEPLTRTIQLERPKVFRAVVFSAEQMDGVPALPKGERTWEWDPLERAEAILQGSGAKVLHDQNDRAFYSPVRDEIHLPGRDQFRNQAAYYGTALHELGHWSGHETRLGRDLGHAFGSMEYAREELRAELASYFLADKLGVPHDIGDHAAYVKSWIKVLKEDHNEIFWASRDAERITEYVIGLDRVREHETAQTPSVQGNASTAKEDPQRALHLGVIAGTMRVQGFSDEAIAKAQAKAGTVLDRLAEQGVKVPPPRVFDPAGRIRQPGSRTSSPTLVPDAERMLQPSSPSLPSR